MWKAVLPGPSPALGAGREGGQASSLLSNALPGERCHGAVLIRPARRTHWEWHWAGAHTSALPLHQHLLHLPVRRSILLRPLQPLVYWAILLLHCLAVIFFLFMDVASLGMVSPFALAFCYGLECSFSTHCNVSSSEQSNIVSLLLYLFSMIHIPPWSALLFEEDWTTGKLAGRVNSMEVKQEL